MATRNGPAGPTTGAELAVAARRWTDRRAAAHIVRGLALALPVVVALLVTFVVSVRLPLVAGLGPFLVRVAILGAIATATLLLVERASRRLLPLATLLRLTLVFPDQAPSRFALALRRGGIKSLRERVDADPSSTGDLTRHAAEVLMLAQALNEHDRRTRGHCERVRAFSMLIAEQMGIQGEDYEKLQWAALLHDVGKLEVPPEILNKPGRPSDEEWAVLSGHPANGGRFMAPLIPWLGDWARASGEHHERWDGAGYPLGLAGQEISLAGRIVCVADAFEVMTAVRSYKPALSVEAARAELTRCAGAQFDPAVVRAMLAVSLGEVDRVRAGFLVAAQVPLASFLGSAPAITKVAVVAAVAGGIVAGSIALPPAPDGATTIAAAVPPGSPDTSTDLSTGGTGGPGGSAPDADGSSGDLDEGAGALSAAAPDPGPLSGDPSVDPTTTIAPVPVGGPSTPIAPSNPTGPSNPVGPVLGPGPTTTLAPAPPTTVAPSQAVAPFVAFLGTGGGGNTASLPGLPLAASPPTVDSLANYDTDRDAFAGLLIAKGGEATAESDLTKRQIWASSGGAPTKLRGSAALRVFAAAKDFDAAKSNRLDVVVQDCDGSLRGCRLLGSGSGSVGPWSSFGPVDIDLGPMDATIGAGRRLVIRVVVSDTSDDDTWLAYGTTSYPAAFTVG